MSQVAAALASAVIVKQMCIAYSLLFAGKLCAMPRITQHHAVVLHLL